MLTIPLYKLKQCGEAPTHGTYIGQIDLLMPETERSLSKYGRVNFQRNYYLQNNTFPRKIII